MTASTSARASFITLMPLFLSAVTVRPEYSGDPRMKNYNNKIRYLHLTFLMRFTLSCHQSLLYDEYTSVLETLEFEFGANCDWLRFQSSRDLIHEPLLNVIRHIQIMEGFLLILNRESEVVKGLVVLLASCQRPNDHIVQDLDVHLDLLGNRSQNSMHLLRIGVP